MSKTSAILKYRTYVPYDWFAIPFCELSFTGIESDTMQEKWDRIKHKRYQEFIPEVNKIVTLLKSNGFTLSQNIKDSKLVEGTDIWIKESYCCE